MKVLKSKEDIKVGDLYSTYSFKGEIELLKISGIYKKGFTLSRLDGYHYNLVFWENLPNIILLRKIDSGIEALVGENAEKLFNK